MQIEARIKKYWDKLSDCEDEYLWAFVIIRLNCEENLQVYIKDVEDPSKMWNTLKKQYKASNLANWDNTISQMIHHSKFDFKTKI